MKKTSKKKKGKILKVNKMKLPQLKCALYERWKCRSDNDKYARNLRDKIFCLSGRTPLYGRSQRRFVESMLMW